MFREEQILLLKQFVSLCKGNPAILHSPELEFFKEWLLSLHAKLPPAPEKPKASHQEEEEAEEISTPGAKQEPKQEPKQEHHDKDSSSEESDVEIESAESDVELEQLSGLLTDEVDVIQEMGDASIEVTDDMVADSNEKRSEAMAALSDGNIEEAIRCFGEAIKKNPHAANLYAKRASVFIQAGKPSAAIRDCEKALSINKDSAQPYKWRGRAYRLLGKYEEAWHDFQLACKLDFDDTTYEWQKEVEPNAKKLAEHRRKCERKHAEFERRQQVKEAQRRKKKAQKEYEEAKKRPPTGGAGGFPGGMPGGFPGGMPGGFPGGMPGGFPGGMPGGFPGGFPGGMPGGGGAAGGMPDIGSLFSDPELMAAMQDPEVMAAFQDVSKNPANMHKYESNPKVKRVIEKLQSKLGGAAKH